MAVVDGEYNPALPCVSAPVFDEEGTSVASLTVALLSAQVTDERIEKKKHVRNTAQNLSKERRYFVWTAFRRRHLPPEADPSTCAGYVSWARTRAAPLGRLDNGRALLFIIVV